MRTKKDLACPFWIWKIGGGSSKFPSPQRASQFLRQMGKSYQFLTKQKTVGPFIKAKYIIENNYIHHNFNFISYFLMIYYKTHATNQSYFELDLLFDSVLNSLPCIKIKGKKFKIKFINTNFKKIIIDFAYSKTKQV